MNFSCSEEGLSQWGHLTSTSRMVETASFQMTRSGQPFACSFIEKHAAVETLVEALRRDLFAGAAERVAAFLGLDLDRAAVAAAVDPRLHGERC